MYDFRFTAWLALAVACGGSLVVGCSDQSPEAGVSRHAIVGGELSPAGGEDDAVLLLRTTTQGESVCTATLLAKNLAVTARHCVAHKSAPLFECTPEGELVPNAWDGGYLGADYPGASIELHGAETPRGEPLARVSQIVSTLSEVICKNDIAFLVLDRDVDLPLRAIRTTRPTSIGELVDLVGYGAVTTGEKLDWQTRERRRLNGRPIVDVGPDLAADGVDRAPPRTVLLEGPASCLGDSGGPALSVDTGAVVGVFSLLGSTDCSAHEVELVYTHTSPFKLLTEQAFEAAGAEPLIEPELPSGQDAGPQQDASAPAEAGPTPGPQPPASADAGCALVGGRSPSWLWIAWLLAVVFAARRNGRRCDE